MMCEPSQKKLSEAMALESGAAPNATLSPFWTDKRRASFKEAIKIGVKATSSLCEGLVEVLPFPGGPCAALLGQVALLVSTAMANHDNLKALQEMAAELMDVIIEKHVSKVDQAANQGGSRAAKAGSRMYYQLMARFRDLLDGILAYTKDYNNKNFIVKLLMTGHAREQYQEMMDNLAKLLANAHFSVSVDTHSLVTDVQSMTAEMKGMVEDIRRRTQYTDRSSEVKHLVDELGGYDAVASSDAKLDEVVKHLDSGQQIEIAVLKKQARAGLMALEAAQEEGVHSLVKHADMRTFWRMCFKGLPKVDWEVWWEAFPSQLMVVVQDKAVVEQVAARLSTDADLRRFQEFVEKRDGETISVKEVNDAFPSGISISMAVDRALGLQEDGVSKATTTSGNAEAKVLCEESLASRQRSMGPNHPSGTASGFGAPSSPASPFGFGFATSARDFSVLATTPGHHTHPARPATTNPIPSHHPVGGMAGSHPHPIPPHHPSRPPGAPGHHPSHPSGATGHHPSDAPGRYTHPSSRPPHPATTPSSTPALGAPSIFGASSAPSALAFGAPSSTPAFGAPSSTSSLFGGNSAFGSTTPSSAPAFGAFGASSVPSSTPAFGAPSTTPAFGAPSFGTSLFGEGSAASSGSFGSLGSAPAFGAPAYSAPAFRAPSSTISAFRAPPSSASAFGAPSSGSSLFRGGDASSGSAQPASSAPCLFEGLGGVASAPANVPSFSFSSAPAPASSGGGLFSGVGPSGEGFKDGTDLLWGPVGDLDLQAPGSTATTTPPNKPPARWQVGTAEPQGCSPKQQLASSSLSRISAGGEPATEQAQPRPPRTAEQEEAELAEAIRLSLLEMEQQRGNSGKQESKTVQDALYSKQAAWMPQALFAASEADLWFTPAAAAAAERKMDKKTKTQQRQEMARKVQLAEQEEAADAAMSQQHQQHQQQQQQQAVPPTQLLSSPTWSTIFTKNKDPISSVAFTPDGTTLVSGFAGYGEDGTSIKLWDLASGNCTATLKEHSDHVQSVAISRDGGVAVSGSSDKTVKLWDLDSRECTATLTGHTEKVKGVAISPDGATIASAAWDGTVRIFKWDAQCWYMWTLLKYSCLMDCVTFSSDGTHLANGGTDSSVWVWDVRSGQSIAELQGHGWGVKSVVFSQDGATVLSGSRDKTIKVWDVRSGRCERTLKGHKDGVQSLALTADGQQAVSGSGALFFNSDTTIKIWDWRNSGECLATLKGHKNDVSSVAVSPDGTMLASGSADRTIRLWEFGRR